ncbi:MAG: hypothetical protein ACLQLG_05095 [Thermoguttaceae bacterium]
MTDHAGSRIRWIFPRRLVTPGGFLWLAAALVLVYLVCDGLGWREYTSVLSGTVEPGDQGGRFLVPGLIYVAAYLGFVVAAPLLALAAGVFSLLLRLWGRGGARKQNPA